MNKIASLKPGDDGVLIEALINHVVSGKTNGAHRSTYLSMTLQDDTGSIDAKLWNASEEQVQTLVKGSVNVEVKNKIGKIYKWKLKPSEKAVCDINEGKISITKVNTIYETAWMEGKLMFKNMPLPQVLKRLSYFYNVKFEIQDPVINSYYFNGTFENKQLSQVLDYLKISSRIDYEIKQAMTDDSQGSQSTMVILRKKKGNE